MSLLARAIGAASCFLVLTLIASPATAQGPAQPNQDPCIHCNLIYSADLAGNLEVIDSVSGTSTALGPTVPSFFDIAISSDGRMFGITSTGSLFEVDVCTLTTTMVGSVPGFNNGLAGALEGPLLYAQGPPLRSIDTSAGFAVTDIGGMVGPDPPDWCGGSSGDLAFNPCDGLLYSTLGCGECSGDLLVILDPATGDVVEEVGCVEDAGGTGFGGLFGIAFDSGGTLWAGQSAGSQLLRIDTRTAVAEVVPVTLPYNGTGGLASIACEGCPCCDACTLAQLFQPLLPSAPPIPSTHPCFDTTVPEPPPPVCCDDLNTLVPLLPGASPLPTTHPCFVP